jgi:hypothetical protein
MTSASSRLIEPSCARRSTTASASEKQPHARQLHVEISQGFTAQPQTPSCLGRVGGLVEFFDVFPEGQHQTIVMTRPSRDLSGRSHDWRSNAREVAGHRDLTREPGIADAHRGGRCRDPGHHRRGSQMDQQIAAITQHQRPLDP